MERVVVGVDGSPASLAVLRWTAAVARRSGTELVAARAWTPDQAELPPDHHAKLLAEAHRELDRWCAGEDLAIAVRTIVGEGDPADVLLAVAHDEAATLVAVGPRGRGGFAGLRVGSTTHHLVHHATLPLAVVPAPAADHDVRRIVVGTDGSAGSAAAVELCTLLATALDVPVTAVHAAEPFLEWVPGSDPQSWRREAEREVQEWIAPLAAAGVSVAVTIDRDVHPVAALCRAAETRPGSIVVVGARGVGGFTGLRLGRVPLQLIHHTDAAVIVTPAGAGAE